MGLVSFFEKRYKKLSKLKNTISEIRGKWHKRKPSIFKRKIDFSDSLNNSYKYSDGNVIYEKILRLIEDTGIDVRRSLTTDLMFDNDIFEDNYNKYRKTDFIYLAPGFKSKKFQTNNLEDLLWLSGIVKEIFSGQFGDFEVPSVILDYVAKARADDRVKDSSLPPNKEYFEKAKKVYETILEKTKITPYVGYSLLGGLWCEMAWAFDKAIVNEDEAAGRGLPGTETYANCGECWFGLTFWNSKKTVISALKAYNPTKYARIPSDQESYKNQKENMLASFYDYETQCKILEIFLNKLAGKHGKNMTGGTEDQEVMLYSSFLFKAGPAREPTLEKVKFTAEAYIKQHEKDYGGEKNPKYRAKDGFATQIFVACMLAMFIDSGEVPKPEDVDKIIGECK